MRLTVYSDYSLRLLMYLALQPERLATIAEVSSAYGISRAHLMKVAHQLGQMGFVGTVRGKGGGLRLAREPAKIGLGDVVRHTEPDFALAPCLNPGDGSCVILPACVLRHAIEQARDAFLAVLDRYTLADLVRPRAPLRGLLQIDPEAGAGLATARSALPT